MNANRKTLIMAPFVLPLLASTAFAQPGGGYGGYHMGFGSWFFGPLMMIAVIALIVVVVVLVLRWSGIDSRPGEPRDRSLDIVKERFARGEIDQSEFEERRSTLTER
jgi:putative membrane protein